MTDIALQHRLHKRHLQQQLKEWNMKADSTTVPSFKALQVRPRLLTRVQKEQKELNKNC